MIRLVLLISLLFSSNATPCVNGGGFLPENDHWIPVNAHRPLSADSVGEADFNNILDKVEEVYGPIVRNYGGNLVIRRNWSDGTVNAYANREGSNFVVEMFGGLARHSTITKDAFALVACHEVGHHIGGVPRYTDQGGTWASTEGQSDYFAVTKCLRKVFLEDNNPDIVAGMQIDPAVTRKCEEQFSIPNDVAICKRISMAGHSSASLFAAMSNLPFPKFETPDPNVVSQTYESHPAYQCRLDTYFQGANCTVSENVEIGQSDPNEGTCNRLENFEEGLRPLCWYKPTTGGGGDGGGNPNPNPPPTGDVAATPTVNGQTSVVSRNPNLAIPISIDVSRYPNVYGLALEFSKPNQTFSNPNSQAPDRVNGLRVEVYATTRGVYNLIPAQRLPGWGSYQIRVIALDRNRRPVSRFSNSLQVVLQR